MTLTITGEVKRSKKYFPTYKKYGFFRQIRTNIRPGDFY